MRIEVIIRRICRYLLFWMWGRSHQKGINNLIYNLKTQNNFNNYPFKKYPPSILNYSFFRKSDLKWLDFYFSVYGKPDQNFISVPIYLYIENCLNDRMLSHAIQEKNFYDKFLHEIPTPRTVLRHINGFYYDETFQKINPRNIDSYLKRYEKLILKPTVDSGAGQSITVFQNNKGINKNAPIELNPSALHKLNYDFIIQEFVTQHHFFSQFNPSSNNTIKVFIYRSISNDALNILHTIFWVGAKGHFLDHDHWGGYGLSINEDNKINRYAIDVYGNKYESVNNIKLALLDEVPAMEKVKALAKQIANNIYYARLLAIDFTINSDGDPLLLDINCRSNGIHQYQMHNGGLFKEFTKPILDYCQRYRSRTVISI